jgi:hypothetical protein
MSLIHLATSSISVLYVLAAAMSVVRYIAMISCIVWMWMMKRRHLLIYSLTCLLLTYSFTYLLAVLMPFEGHYSTNVQTDEGNANALISYHVIEIPNLSKCWRLWMVIHFIVMNVCVDK